MKWFKTLFDIKDYRACIQCHMVYEESDSVFFWEYCPTCRKPHLEQRDLEQWAMMWARKHPEDAKQIREKDLAEENKINASRQQQWADYQARAVGSQQGILNGLGLGGIVRTC